MVCSSSLYMLIPYHITAMCSLNIFVERSDKGLHHNQLPVISVNLLLDTCQIGIQTVF